MGLFDDLGVDMDSIKAGGFSDPDDGTYEFIISEGTIRNGSTNKPDTTFYTIEYSLDEAGSKTEWFTIAENGVVTERALQSLGFLKSRLQDLGIDASEFDPEETDLEGISGVFQLKTTKDRKGIDRQNIRNVKVDVDEADVSDEPTDYDDGSAAQYAAIKKRVQAKRAEREEQEAAPVTKAAPVKKAPARKPKPAPVEDDGDDDENPFE